MCQQFDVLAQHSTSNFVARCEHGTVHLAWAGGIWLLTTPEMISLTDFVLNDRPALEVGEGFSFTTGHAGRTVLWNGACALAFSSEGLEAFRRLLLVARTRLEYSRQTSARVHALN